MDQSCSSSKGYNKIFWGILLTTFNFNYFGIPIPPQFIKWLIVGKGISELKEAHPSNSFIYAGEWGSWLTFLTFIGGSVSLLKPEIFKNGTLSTIIWSTGITALELLLKYYILAGSINLSKMFLKDDVVEGYIKSTRNYIISYIVVIVFQIISLTILLDKWLVVSGIASIILNIWFMALINEFKNTFSKEAIYDQESV